MPSLFNLFSLPQQQYCSRNLPQILGEGAIRAIKKDEKICQCCCKASRDMEDGSQQHPKALPVLLSSISTTIGLGRAFHTLSVPHSMNSTKYHLPNQVPSLIDEETQIQTGRKLSNHKLSSWFQLRSPNSLPHALSAIIKVSCVIQACHSFFSDVQHLHLQTAYVVTAQRHYLDSPMDSWSESAKLLCSIFAR